MIKKRKEQTESIPNYVDIPENLYRGAILQQRYIDDVVSSCKCSPETGGCGNNCMNRLLYIECDPATCPCTSRDSIGNLIPCENTVIQFGRYPKLQVFRTPNSGFALKVLEDVPEDYIICEYRGEVLTVEQSIKRMSKYKASDGFYFAALGNNLVLDASKMGSVARFANHSCDPNSYLQRWTVGGESRIVLTANEPLKAGTEICYSYNFNDDGFSSNPIKSQKCYCGSAFCTGTVGGLSTMRHDINDTFHYMRRILNGEIKLTKQQIEHFIEGTAQIQEASKLVRDQVKLLKKLLDQINNWSEEAQRMIMLQEPVGNDHIYASSLRKRKSVSSISSTPFDEIYPFMRLSSHHFKKLTFAGNFAAPSISYARAWPMEDIGSFLQQIPPGYKSEEEKTLRTRLIEAQKLESELLQWKNRLFGNDGSEISDKYFILLEKWRERYNNRENSEFVGETPCIEKKRGRKRRKVAHRRVGKRQNSELENQSTIVEERNSSTMSERVTHPDSEQKDDGFLTDDSSASDVDEMGTDVLVSLPENIEYASKSTAPVFTAPDPSVSLSWPLLCSLLRKVFSVLPIRCNHSDWLFSILDYVDQFVYQECTNSKSSPQYIPEVMVNRYRSIFLQPKKTDQSHLYNDAMVVAQLWRHYGPSLQDLSFDNDNANVFYKLSHGTWSAHQEKHWLYAWIAPEYFQHTLSQHTLRVSALSSLYQPIRPKKDALFLQYHGFPKSNVENLVYCFCRLPEPAMVLSGDMDMKSLESLVLSANEDAPFSSHENKYQKKIIQYVSQCTTMIQCDGCTDWFHPLCCAQRFKPQATTHSSLKQAQQEAQTKIEEESQKDERSLALSRKRKQDVEDSFICEDKTILRLKSSNKRAFRGVLLAEAEERDTEKQSNRSVSLQQTSIGANQSVEEIYDEETEDTNKSRKFYCPTCTLNMGHLADYAYTGQTAWDDILLSSLKSLSIGGESRMTHIHIQGKTESIDAKKDALKEKIPLLQERSGDLFRMISVSPLLQQYKQHIDQWLTRASTFLHQEAKTYLQSWVQTLFLPASADSTHSNNSLSVVLSQLLFPAHISSSMVKEEKQINSKKGNKSKASQLKKASQDTNDNATNHDADINDEKKKKRKKKDDLSDGLTESSESDRESPLAICFKRAAALFLEPYFLLGSHQALPAEIIMILYDLRLLLWILSTHSIWDILYRQYRIHEVSALVAANSPFKSFTNVSDVIHEEEKVQVTLTILRKVVTGGTALHSLSSNAINASVLNPLFRALFGDAQHLLKFTETLLFCGQQSRHFTMSQTAAYSIVYGNRRTSPFLQKRKCIETIMDLLDLDGRSVVTGGACVLDDDELRSPSSEATSNRLSTRKCPVAHYDVACLFSLAQQQIIQQKRSAVDASATASSGASNDPTEVSGSSMIDTSNLVCATPKEFINWLNQHDSNDLEAENKSRVHEEEEERYCWCNQPDDGQVPMLACDQCDAWFHSSCVRMWSRLRHHQKLQAEYRKLQRQSLAKNKKSKIETTIIQQDEDLPAPPAELSFICIGCSLLQRKDYSHAWSGTAST